MYFSLTIFIEQHLLFVLTLFLTRLKGLFWEFIMVAVIRIAGIAGTAGAIFSIFVTYVTISSIF